MLFNLIHAQILRTNPISAVFVLLAVAAFGEIIFPDGSTATTGELTNVTIVQAGGSPSQNGTALRAVLDAISGANTTPRVVQLAAGTYDLGTSTLTMKPFVHLRGVGMDATIITGSGDGGTGVLVEGADESVLIDLSLRGSASGIILVRMREADSFFKLTEVILQLATAGGGSGTSVKVRNGVELDLVRCELVGDASNPGGTRVGVDVAGTDSFCELNDTILDMIESGTGTVVALQTASGADVTVLGGDIVVERETAGSALTAVIVGSGSQVFFGNTQVTSIVNTANSVAAVNAGGLKAFSTMFVGTIPDPNTQFFTSATDCLLYSQCADGLMDISSL